MVGGCGNGSVLNRLTDRSDDGTLDELSSLTQDELTPGHEYVPDRESSMVTQKFLTPSNITNVTSSVITVVDYKQF